MAKICEACGKEYRFPVGFGYKICRHCIIYCPKCGKKKGLLNERQISKQRKGLCDECSLKEQKRVLKDEKLTVTNPEAGFRVQDLKLLKQQLKEVGRKTCLDCCFCQLREETVEKIGIPSLLNALVGTPSEFEMRIHLVCRKFLLDLNDKLESGEKCSSFLTEDSYEEKCLKGEIVGYAGIDKKEMMKPEPIMATCQYCNAQYDISLYRKCPRCGAYSTKTSKEVQ